MDDFRLTLDQLERANEAHGGPRAALVDGDAAHLTDWCGDVAGWCAIRRDPATRLFSYRDLRAALGY